MENPVYKDGSQRREKSSGFEVSDNLPRTDKSIFFNEKYLNFGSYYIIFRAKTENFSEIQAIVQNYGSNQYIMNLHNLFHLFQKHLKLRSDYKVQMKIGLHPSQRGRKTDQN